MFLINNILNNLYSKITIIGYTVVIIAQRITIIMQLLFHIIVMGF